MEETTNMTTFTGKAKYFAGNGLIINCPSDEEKIEYSLLKTAQAETENSEYNSITEIDPTIVATIPKNILKDAFKEANLGLSAKESDELADLVLAYREDKKTKLYKNLPDVLKKRITSLYNQIGGNAAAASGVSKEDIAREIINSILDNSEINAAMAQLDLELSKYTAESTRDMVALFSDACNELFSKIDEIRAEDPERADMLLGVKTAFDDATNFNKQIEYLNSDKPRNVRKYHRRAHAITDTFNNLVNVGEIKIPNINELFDIIKLRLPQYNKDQINEFIILLCRSTMDLDFSVLSNIAYVYKLVDRIYKFKFITAGYEDEETTQVFNDISGVIELIQKRKEEGGNK